jgi:hypothetical protein
VTVTQTFLDVARELIERPEAKAAFADDPPAFLAARGLGDLSAAELDEALGYVADAVPALEARQLAETPPAAAPEPAALARMAATTVVDEAARETDNDPVDFLAVLDPAGSVELPQAVEITSLDAPAAAPIMEEGEEAGESADAVAVATGEPMLEPDEDAPPTDGETEGETEETEAAVLDELTEESDEAGDEDESNDGTDDLLSEPFVDELTAGLEPGDVAASDVVPGDVAAAPAEPLPDDFGGDELI